MLPTKKDRDARQKPAEDIAVSASLAMALEASAYPKPGNVHRLKDFKNTNYEHFLASAIASAPVFIRAASGGEKLGNLLEEAVQKSERRQSGGNTHFGTFLLLLPLSMAAGIENDAKIKKDAGGNQDFNKTKQIVPIAFEICKKTDSEDAFYFYSAFEKLNIPAKTKISGTDMNFDLADPESKNRILAQKTGLFELMESAASRDLIAKEWVSGFEKTKWFAKRLMENHAFFLTHPEKQFKNAINSSIVYTFLEMMASVSDTFIETKIDSNAADKIREEARGILNRFPENEKDLQQLIPFIHSFDDKLHEKRANPGSLADIAAAGIFLALMDGLVF
ncbi:triphosphoribosyl-dephospho-CoA synthase [Methanolapillus ohkumae]|uniref:2-(5''-triphosphoribosyl)-3'-dephosphocoenzyme-A synthase n=1 Tax=Methanolapillus ohkumae TaxID=3028298 RepID=A0AA96VIT7_9EURY|nr:2-(5''-triphosphoribosyl)-3'-dephosphocoenzyme-A synthase [Methanosarcinaceae archaeon Am2]